MDRGLLSQWTGIPLAYHQVIWRNRLRRLFFPIPNHTFLFILSPTYCGSTLLHELLSTSGNVSGNNNFNTREGQLLPGVSNILFHHDRRWDETLDFDWALIKKKWWKYWDVTKPILLEKSPPNVLRASSIEQAFRPSSFIILTRNPYAQAHSIIRRNGFTPEASAQFIMKALQYQRHNLDHLENKLWLPYERLTSEPGKAVSQIQLLVPNIGSLITQGHFSAHNFKKSKLEIINLNEEKITDLDQREIKGLNHHFGKNEALINSFGYELIT